MDRKFILMYCFLACTAWSFGQQQDSKQTNPNIVLIYADDLGYGDLSSYGASAISTPNIDALAASGIRFTKAYATSATCTPSRFSLLTGRYAWRKTGTEIAPGDAALIIPTAKETLPGMLKRAGYTTAVVGKWHLGLGPAGGPEWNKTIQPGPLEVGFDYSFIMPATGDRVPCVYVENHRIVDLEPADPVTVNYKQKTGTEHTGLENPELLKMHPSHGHNNTIINGVSRIGWMKGGKNARWIDEDMADVFVHKAQKFIQQKRSQPFFLFFSTHDIHVPRLPNPRFAGKSGMGPRGDALLQLDWSVGAIMDELKRQGLDDNTLVIFTSDNGPVIDDGYKDDAVEKLGAHDPFSGMRGGKYSAFEAGTKVPLIVRWPGRQVGMNSPALFSQIDLFSSLAALVKKDMLPDTGIDSENNLPALQGNETKGRAYVIQQSINNRLAVNDGKWKYIEPGKGPAMDMNTNIELGNDPAPQLYDLVNDPGERKNLAASNPAVLQRMQQLLAREKNKPAK